MMYSYGIVLLELITRKTPRYDGYKYNSLKENFIKSYAAEEKAHAMYDEEIASPDNIEFLQMVGSVAIECLGEKLDDRPSMEQVAEGLRSVRREWRQRPESQGDDCTETSAFSITMVASGAETPGYYHFKKRNGNFVVPVV